MCIFYSIYHIPTVFYIFLCEMSRAFAYFFMNYQYIFLFFLCKRHNEKINNRYVNFNNNIFLHEYNVTGRKTKKG